MKRNHKACKAFVRVKEAAKTTVTKLFDANEWRN